MPNGASIGTKDGRMIINRGAEIGATMVFGGAAGGKAIGTQAGRIFLGTESAYNIGAGIIGKDVAQPNEQGNARQMPIWERGLRVAGGVFGARQTTNTKAGTPNSITNKAVDKLDDIFKNSTIKPHGEFVTPLGLRVKTNSNGVSENILLPKALTEKLPVGRRNLNSHEDVSDVQEGKEIVYAILEN